MSSEEVRLLRRLVAEFVEQFEKRQKDERRKFRPGSLEDFLELAGFLLEHPEWRQRRIPAFDLLGTAAMILLGPPGRLPTRRKRLRILLTIRSWVPDPALRLMALPQLMLAYGCGFRRQVRQGAMGWGQLWDQSQEQMRRILEALLADLHKSLARIVPRYDLRVFNNSDYLRQTAERLMNIYLWPEDPFELSARQTLAIECHPGETLIGLDGPERKVLTRLPDGGRHVIAFPHETAVHTPAGPLPAAAGSRLIITAGALTTRLEVLAGHRQRKNLKAGQRATLPGPAGLRIFACSCGHNECPTLHRFENHVPGEYDLVAVLADFLRGPGVPKQSLKRIYTNAFTRGAYLPWHSRQPDELRLRKVTVVCRFHPECDCSRSQRPKPRLFEGPKCWDCGGEFNPRTMVSVPQERLTLVGDDPPSHVRQTWCMCPECETPYDLDGETAWFHETWEARGRCQRCDSQVWDPDNTDHQEELRRLVETNRTNFERARALERLLRRRKWCPQCGQPLTLRPWCPHCARREPRPEATCLPDKGLSVWRATDACIESLELMQASKRAKKLPSVTADPWKNLESQEAAPRPANQRGRGP
jgi:hypothetical protein